MIVKILGGFDIVAALVIFFSYFNFIPEKLILFIALILLAKGIFFLISKDIASAIDVVIAIVLISSTQIHIPYAITALMAFFLIQKGFFSWLA
ncbi:MAG: hypothetical protein WC533_03820 [Candidatus Pacearchaeota archaeon]